MACRCCTIVRVEVRGEIPKGAHGNFPNFPANFHGEVETQKAVDTGLIATGIARIMDIKRVTIACVVVEGWRELEVRDVREIKLRTHLPAEHECIGKRDLLSLTASGRRTVRRYYWLRRCRGWSNWVRR